MTPNAVHDIDSVRAPSAGAASRATLTAAIEAAAGRIAPVWPLDSFVAVNPFHGLLDLDRPSAAARLAATSGARSSQALGDYLRALRDGRIGTDDLREAIARMPQDAALPRNPQALQRYLAGRVERLGTAPDDRLPTATSVASSVGSLDIDGLASQCINAWAGLYFDRNQAAWRAPWQQDSAFDAWRRFARHDRSPGVAGMKGFRAFCARLPGSAEETITHAVARLALPAERLELYFHRLLASLEGWGAWGRYRAWQAELQGGHDGIMTDLLAIRLAWELAALDSGQANREFASSWSDARRAYREHDDAEPATDTVLGLVLQDALDLAWQRRTLSALQPGATASAPNAERAPGVQAAFCIDVRSEPMRRALEAQDPDLQTMGFAGFFGVAMAWQPAGAGGAQDQCPVLLAPATTVHETGRDAAQLASTGARRQRRAWRAGLLKRFRQTTLSSFAFVGTLGIVYAGRLLADLLGWTRPVAALTEARDELAPDVHAALDAPQRLDTAEGILRGMSLTDGFARLVMLAGHGSSSLNNPHAAGLDCGACGGHGGASNARTAVALLNDPEVRRGLAERGIDVPTSTLFVAALHDTTTDRVELLDLAQQPDSHRSELDTLQAQLLQAGDLALAERQQTPRDSTPRRALALAQRRSRDISQVRPEWGLAGCAAFIAARREHSRDIDLGGRAFLHDYCWQRDEGFGVLTTIMTAPMVVASWINLQYYGSAVDNVRLGSGNKTLHNVVGGIGVLEGNGGALRTGLPWQSLHDGHHLVHEPLRLTCIVQAPLEAMNAVIREHDMVRHLVDHGWLHLLAMDDAGRVTHRYEGDCSWQALDVVEDSMRGVA